LSGMFGLLLLDWADAGEVAPATASVIAPATRTSGTTPTTARAHACTCTRIGWEGEGD